MTTEVKIHLYIINKSLLSESDVADIENRILSDGEFREFIDHLKIIHDDTGKIGISVFEVNNFLLRLSIGSMHTYELKSMFHEEEEDRKMKLAAMQENEPGDKFQYFNTYATADNFILIRVFNNPSNNNYRFYVITEDMENAGYSVLRINSPENVYIADDKGIVTFQSAYLNKNINLKISLPADIFTIEVNDIKGSYNSEKKSSLTEMKAALRDNMLEIDFSSGYLEDKEFFAVFNNDLSSLILPEISGSKLLLDPVLKDTEIIKLISIFKS